MKTRTIFSRTMLALVPFGFTMSALAGSTLSVTETTQVAASPDKVWEVIGDFAGLPGWHPAVLKTDIVKGNNNRKGAVRSITTKDGAKIVEELSAYSSGKHSMTYRIIESPLPVKDYVSTLLVAPAGKGSRITWKSSFNRDAAAAGVDDAKAKDIVSGIYKAGFDGLRGTLGEQATVAR